MGQNKDLITALDQIEREKGVKKEDVLVMIEGAIASALRKHHGRMANIICVIDRGTGAISAVLRKKVVEVVADAELEILLNDAKKWSKTAEVGTDVDRDIPTAGFERIAAQTAKQVLIQKIREIERDNLYEEYKPKEGEMVTGSVHRFMERNIIVELGKAEAILPVREQIRRERYNIGDRIRAVILKVDKAQRGPQVVLSRATPDFLRRLFEMEVPEVSERVIEIVDIARDPGFRAKVVVRSNNPKVDAVGACVGIRGSRIRSIMNELSGERIDLIPFSPETSTFIMNAIAPGKANSVRIIDPINRQAEVIVPNDQLALTIGREGQNIRLACRLTGWSLAVKSEQQKSDEVQKSKEALRTMLEVLEGIGPKTAEVIIAAGFADIYKLADMNLEYLTTLQGVGEKTAEKIIESAKAWVADHPKVEPVLVTPTAAGPVEGVEGAPEAAPAEAEAQPAAGGKEG
ncbi:MAG: transcription termination/antitermination protein NusA [Elusimicrobia bacterium]|nr:transcription termination/antitermination protein NusA [Elusimicrobiota bacterium]